MAVTSKLVSLRLGFVPLADAAPLIMAKERGFFEKYGLDVQLQKVSSWARMRDLLAIGDIQGAHMLAPMVAASVLGLEPGTPPFTTALSLNMNGNAITVSNALYAAMYSADSAAIKQRPMSARALKSVVTARQGAGQDQLTFAMVYPFSSHNYQLRYWLAAAGIHPDRDIRIVVVPPPKVMDYMRAGIIDGYCVGEPWNSEAVDAGVGTTLITSQELMGLAPEKVFAVTQRWASDNQDIHEALISALLECCAWLEDDMACAEAASVMASHTYVGAHAKHILSALTGQNRETAGGIIMNMPDFNVFHRYVANFPWRSHAAWFITQMYRWGQLHARIDMDDTLTRAYQPELFRKVAKARGHIYPLSDYKDEGDKTRPWVMTDASAPVAFGANQHIDGRIFKHATPDAYVESFDIHSLRLGGK